jgi:hypothetical protein
MEKLIEHTLQRQLEEQKQATDALQKQVAKLTGMLERQLAIPQAQTTATGPDAKVAVINGDQQNYDQRGAVVLTLQVTNYWNAERCIEVPLELVRGLFTTNPRLTEFVRRGEAQESAEAAAPYVLEALLEIVRACHGDPRQRNVYLSPKRADQVLVWCCAGPQAEGGRPTWEVRTLVEAIRRIFDGVAEGLHELILDDAARPKLGDVTLAGAVGWVPIHYQEEPGRYVEEAKRPMAAHLTTVRALAAPASAPEPAPGGSRAVVVETH